VLGRLLLLGIAHQHVGHWQLIAELPGRALGQRAVQDVLPEWAALVGLIVIGLALGFEINRGAVQCRRDRAGKEGAIVAGIVPSKPAFVAAFLPEGGPKFDRLERLLAVERYLAVFLDLLAAPRPQIGIEEGRRIAEAMAHGLADRLAFGLELFAGGTVLVPGFWKLRDPDRIEPRFAISVLVAKDAPGDADPFLAIVANSNRLFVEAALILADFLGDVADVGRAIGVELRPIIECANH